MYLTHVLKGNKEGLKKFKLRVEDPPRRKHMVNHIAPSVCVAEVEGARAALKREQLRECGQNVRNTLSRPPLGLSALMVVRQRWMIVSGVFGWRGTGGHHARQARVLDLQSGVGGARPAHHQEKVRGRLSVARCKCCWLV
jgi:hypothetical protein